MRSTRLLIVVTLLLSMLLAGCSAPSKPQEPAPAPPPEIPAVYKQALQAMHDRQFTEASRLLDQTAALYAGSAHAHQARLLQVMIDYANLKLQNERMERYRQDVIWWHESLQIDENAIKHYQQLLDRHKEIDLANASIMDRERILSWREQVEKGPIALASRIERERPRVEELGIRLESERAAMMHTLRSDMEAALQSHVTSDHTVPYIDLDSPKLFYIHDLRPYFPSEADGNRWEAQWKETAPLLLAQSIFSLRWRYIAGTFDYDGFFAEVAALLEDNDPLKRTIQQKEW